MGAWLASAFTVSAANTSSTSFIEPILEALIAGRRVNAGNNMVLGCFCNKRTQPPAPAESCHRHLSSLPQRMLRDLQPDDRSLYC